MYEQIASGFAVDSLCLGGKDKPAATVLAAQSSAEADCSGTCGDAIVLVIIELFENVGVDGCDCDKKCWEVLLLLKAPLNDAPVLFIIDEADGDLTIDMLFVDAESKWMNKLIVNFTADKN